MKQTSALKLATMAVVVTMFVPAADVSAVSHGNSAGQAPAGRVRLLTADEVRQRAETARKEAKDRTEAKKSEITAKLDARRLQICQQREQKINNLTDDSVIRARVQFAVFQKIEARVVEFQQTKSLTVPDFDSLVAEVNTKESAAIAAIESTGVASFDCSAEGSQRQLGLYVKSLVLSHQAALKDYRTAIKNLIVAVVQAQKQSSAAGAATQPASQPSTAPRTNQTDVRQEGIR